MNAEVVSVGTELLLGQIVDTNAAELGRALSAVGVAVHRRVTVGDNHVRLLSALREALEVADAVITIGGLGPTQDDITRDVLAEAIGDVLRFDEAIADRLRGFFASRGLPLLQSNLRQAYVPVSGRPIENPNGTAPGLLFEKSGKIGIALPGPPNEFVPMLHNHVIPYLRSRIGPRTIHSRVLRVCGIGESMVEHMVVDLVSGANPTVAPYAKLGEVHLRVTASAASVEEAEALMAPVITEIERRLGSHLYAFDDELLEAAVVRMLSARNLTVAVAESCTGGLLGARLTDVAGSSAVFLGGVVAYSNAAKQTIVGVPPDVIETHGAVSPETAAALAEGARDRFGASFGVGITGIAGPDGGSAEKPVGTVHIAVADRREVTRQANRYLGSRADVRRRATQSALTLLRDLVIDVARG